MSRNEYRKVLMMWIRTVVHCKAIHNLFLFIGYKLSVLLLREVLSRSNPFIRKEVTTHWLAMTFFEIVLLTLAMTIIGDFAFNSSFAQETDSIGIVTVVRGKVTLTRAGGSETIVEGTRVLLGDRFDTEEESGVKIVFNDDTLMSLGASATLSVTEFVYTPTKRKSFSNLIKGKLKAIIQDFPGGESDVEFATPNAVAGIKGTTVFIDADKEDFFVSDGDMFVMGLRPGAKEVILAPGEFAQILPNGNPSDPEPVPPNIEKELIEGTDVDEKAPDTEASHKEEYPGKEEGGEETPSGLAELVTAPLAQPVNLLPGVNGQDEAPVVVIINP